MSGKDFVDGLRGTGRGTDSTHADGAMLLRLPVSMIDADPDQVRRTFDEQKLRELAESIRRVGLLQPIRVKRSPVGGRYTIVAGERRWRACVMVGAELIDALLVAERDETELMREAQIIENLQRDNPAPLEVAAAYRRYLDDFGCSQAELARRLGISTATVSRALALLEAPEDVRAKLAAGESVRKATGAGTRRKPVAAPHDKRRALELELESGSVRVKRGHTLEQLVDELRARIADQVRPADAA